MAASPISTETRAVRAGDATFGLRIRPGADGALPIVFLHGYAGEGADWDAVWQALPPGSFGGPTLIAPDRRGQGDTAADDPAAPYAHADDLAALLDALGIARAHLVGVSEGGATALAFALEHPARVARLVLVSPMVFGWRWSADWIERWQAIAAAAQAGRMAEARALWRAHPLFATLAGPAAAAFDAGLARFSGARWAADPMRRPARDAERLATLAVPTLLLAGTQDIPDFRAMADTLAAAPGLVRQDLVAGHMLHLEVPATVAAAIAGFLEEAITEEG